MTVIIAGHISFDPEAHDAIAAAALEMMEATAAEPGCIEYVFSADPRDRARLLLFEKWESAADLEPHMLTDHMAKWRNQGAELGINGRDISWFEVTNETSL